MVTAPSEFEELVRPHVDALYRTALRMTGDPAAAEDLVQDAFLKAWKNFHRFERGTNFKAWIFTILTNTDPGTVTIGQRVRLAPMRVADDPKGNARWLPAFEGIG